MARQSPIRLRLEGFYYTLVVAAVLTGAIARQLNLLMLVGSLLAGPLLFAALYGWLALRRVRAERKLPTHLRADERLVVDLMLTNRRGWLSVWGIKVEDTARHESPLAEPARASVFFPMIVPHATRQAAYSGILPRRGRYHFGPLRLSTRFPMGLFRHTVVLEQRESLLVHPKLGRLSRNWAEVARETPLGGPRMQRRGLLEAEFYGIRDWRAGDSRRWIHWRTSARRGSLVVRQFEQRRSEDLAVLIDLWQPSDPRRQDLDNVEIAISFAATLIADACREPGRQLTLALGGGESLFSAGAAGPAFFREQMDALALATPHHETSFPRALSHALAMTSASVGTLIISTRDVDWEALRSTAAARDAQLDGRTLRIVNVADAELSRYFTP
jgi:uncharacterized protein (DUF58 family)